MRVIIFFDLPTGTPVERKAYMQFRKYLLNAGYDMLQYSVYVRIAGSWDDAQHMLGIVKRHLPGKGQVRALMVTESSMLPCRSFSESRPSQRKRPVVRKCWSYREK